MDEFSVSTLADWLEEHTSALLDKTELLDLKPVYAAIDYLGVLKNPAASYPEMGQETYLRSESDKKLSLLDEKKRLSELDDRIMVNHVDGSVTNDEINFKYNHDTPVVDGEYHARKDLEILKFGLEVIGAVSTTGHDGTIREALSSDAVLSLVLAANAFYDWQLK
ncbi:hypothetical protein [Lacticaseibacillus hulanensis]|uniref:hypothetical protein n=1 Tax=Lacticaseibacillus hulanensis TaxID=2493111 RepID=UPI000FD7B1F4|nr:hypothetical protein [Lacticaseibacillus hulanensis]